MSLPDTEEPLYGMQEEEGVLIYDGCWFLRWTMFQSKATFRRRRWIRVET
jgi:hypothetical protein